MTSETIIGRAIPMIVRAMTIIIVASLAAGLVAAVVGGPLEELGSGPGGLYGLPNLALSLVAVVLAMAAAIDLGRRVRRRQLGSLGRVAVVVIGAWVVAIGYFVVAHIIDPCLNGWWDLRSRVGSQRLCHRYGSELNWHPRFHLVAHAGPATALLAAYALALRRTSRPSRSS